MTGIYPNEDAWIVIALIAAALFLGAVMWRRSR